MTEFQHDAENVNEDADRRPRLQAHKFSQGKDGGLRGTIQEIDADGNPTGVQHSGNFSNLRQREVFAAHIENLRGIPREEVLKAINQLLKEVRAKLEEANGDPEQNKKVARESAAQRIKDAAEKAAPLLRDPALLHRAIHAVEDLGVVGERRNIGALHLCARSRALPRPVNLEVNSPPASGKTYIVTTTFSLECPEAVYEMTAGSERSLVFLGEPLDHRIIYIQEPEGLMEGVGAAVIKSISWEGRLKYDTVIKGENGEYVGQHIEKDGPTGLVICTTHPLEEQMSSRMVPLETDASEEQTKRILDAIAASKNGVRLQVDLEPWQALSYILGEPVDVEIPFAPYLAENISVKTLRIRRDFTQLLTLIQASAVEHRYQRAAATDNRLIATLADYAHVHSLLKDVFEAAQAEGITIRDREMVQAVIDLSTSADGEPGASPVSQAAVRDHLKLSKSSASYRVRRLLRLGYLANLADKGKPMQLVSGTPLPDEPEPLPTPCDLAAHLMAMKRDELVQPWMNPVTGEVHDCRLHLGLETTNFFSSCQECFETQVDSVADSRPEGWGSATIEPLNPDDTKGSKVQSAMNPNPSVADAVAEPDLGFKALSGEGENICELCHRLVPIEDVEVYTDSGVICGECYQGDE